MKSNQTIETQLDCKAVASLQDQVDLDMLKQDKSLASILNESDEEESDEIISSD